jgi:hypothetical protein
MRHLNQDELTLYYYGDPSHEGRAERHLGECEECRAEYQRLQRVLNSVDAFPVPERLADYEERVWRAVAPAIGVSRPRRSWWPSPKTWALAGGLASLVVAFFAGRALRESDPTPGVTQAGQRILMLAVDEHLERSQLVLIEIANAPQGQARDISFERGTAEELLGANRLYRQTAALAGDTGTAEILEDLERVLLEIAHSPPQVSAAEVEELRRDIQDREILTKVKVFGSRVREQEEDRL